MYVVDVGYKMKLLTKGNLKLSNTTLIWNLPAEKTCPKATKQCKMWCYAKKAEKIYPNVLPFRNDNLWYSKLKCFVKGIKNTITNHINRDKIKPEQIRIHESGDFYNQKYLNDWIRIANKFPNKIFYAYTKSYHLNYSKRPKNFIILLSDDNKAWKEYWHKFDGLATVVPNNIKPFETSFDFNCPMSCKSCSYCFTKTNKFKRVLLPKH